MEDKKTYKIGVIGVWGRGNLARYAHKPEEGFVIHAGTDVNQENIKIFQEKYPEAITAFSRAQKYEKEFIYESYYT